jgi:hypothetical protein
MANGAPLGAARPLGAGRRPAAGPPFRTWQSQGDVGREFSRDPIVVTFATLALLEPLS